MNKMPVLTLIIGDKISNCPVEKLACPWVSHVTSSGFNDYFKLPNCPER